MTNERLRSAVIGSGRPAAHLAADIGVDPKTLERWIANGRVPHRTHRLRTAQILTSDDAYLWPDTADDTRSEAASRAEFLQLYNNRGAVSVRTWQQLLESSVEAIDLLAISASFLHDSIPDFDDMLWEKAEQGVSIRLLFADRTSDMVRLRGHEEGIEHALAGRADLTWAYFQPLLGHQCVQARMHGCTLYNSIFRFDSDLLANTHVYGSHASRSPVVHLHRIAGGRLFNHYMESFDRTWATGTPVEPAAS